MTKISFLTAIKYHNDNCFSNNLLDKVDNYFYLGGKKAHVLPEHTKDGKEKVMLSDTHSSILARFAKFISYFTIFIPIVMLVAKIALRSRHSFKVIDPKSKLEKGIDINEETISKLQRLMSKISARKDDDEIVWLSKGNNLVFKLADSSDLVFKMAPLGVSVWQDGKTLDSKAKSEQRFANMIKAKEVCLTHQLGQMIIPHARKIEVEVDKALYTLIVEEALDFDSNESAQEELYHKYSTELNETARQLAIFIANTGFNDVTWRNIPILNEEQECRGPRRVALIDLEHMYSAVNGFMGDSNGSCGLIQCLSSEQEIDIVIEEAKKQGIKISEKTLQKAKERKLEELESNQELLRFYKKNRIVTGKELIQVDDLDSLGLDLTEKGKITVPVIDETTFGVNWEKQTITLKQVTEDVIAEMNEIIRDSSDTASVKGKRYFVLNTNKIPFKEYDHLGIPPGEWITERNKKQLWLRRIIQALIEKGHLFKLDQYNGHGYFIQA